MRKINKNGIVTPFQQKGWWQKDSGMSLTPWVLLYFFIIVYLFFLLFCHSMHISTKYVVQDALASAALAAEVADLEVLGGCQELVITDLDTAKDAFYESLQATLQLTEQGYPSSNSAYFDDRMPVHVEELTLYNVAQGQVYKTDLLHENGILLFMEDTGFSQEERCDLQGKLLDAANQYNCGITMLNGETKQIKNTSLYARISFGVKGYDQSVVRVEKDILTDIQLNE